MSSNTSLTIEQLDKVINAAASQTGVPYDLLFRLLDLESDHFAADVISGQRKSSAGAIGIGQFMPDTARELGVNPYDPVSSIFGAAKYLRQNATLLNGGKFPTTQDPSADIWQKATAAYDAGPGAVQKAIRTADPKIPGTNISASGGLIKGLAGGFADIFGDNPTKWQTHLPDETKKYISVINNNNQGPLGADRSIADLTKEAYKGLGINQGSSTTQRKTVPTGSVPPAPDWNDFYLDLGDGTLEHRTNDYYQAFNQWQQIRALDREFNLGPQAQYIDDIIQQISQEIAAGGLSISKADGLLSTRLKSFAQAQQAFEGDAFKYATPIGSEYVKGREPDSYAVSKLGLKPRPVEGAGLQFTDPIQEALNTIKQSESLYSGIKIPDIPNYASLRTNIPGSVSPTTPSGSLSALNAGSNVFQQALNIFKNMSAMNDSLALSNMPES